MTSTLRDMLLAPTLPLTIVPDVMQLLAKLEPAEDERIQFTAEIISDIREPLIQVELRCS